MPYKDKEKQKQRQREIMQAKRQKVHVNPCEPLPVNPKPVNLCEPAKLKPVAAQAYKPKHCVIKLPANIKPMPVLPEHSRCMFRGDADAKA